MIGVLVNTLTVLIGSTVGLIFHKFIPKNIADNVLKVLGLCTIYLGITGMMTTKNALILIIAGAAGTLIGEALKLEDRLSNGLSSLERRFSKNGESGSVSAAFLNACMVFCIGSMTLVGCMNAGLIGDNTMLFTKSTLDLFSSCVFASTMGFGVLLAAAFVFVFQGLLVLCSSLLAGILSTAVITEIAAAGSIAMLALGFNLSGISKFKVLNMLPAMLIAPILCLFLL